MADQGNRWGVGRDWPDPEQDPGADTGASDTAASDTLGRGYRPDPPPPFPPPAYPPAAGQQQGAYPPAAGHQQGPYPPGVYPPFSRPLSRSANQPISTTPPAVRTTARGGYQQAAPLPPSGRPAPGSYQPGLGYPPGAYPPGSYPAQQPPAHYAPYYDNRAAVPMVDDELPRGGLIRPSRVLLLAALLVSGGVVVYGFFVEKGGLQIPISIVGLVMLGVSLLLTALASLRGGLRASREGSVLRSAAVAVFGGMCALAAAGSFAMSVFLGRLYQP